MVLELLYERKIDDTAAEDLIALDRFDFAIVI